MEYKLVKYNSREEMIAAYRKMKQRKKEWIAEQQRDFQRIHDSTIKTVDVGAFIKKHPHPQYNSYLNENKFKKFKIEFGNIVWGKNWDLIFPVDCLYAGTCE